MKLSIPFFPFPYIKDGVLMDGALVKWPDICIRCKLRRCQTTGKREYSICSYGFNFKRITQGISLGGFLLRNWFSMTPARKKRLKSHKGQIISKQDLNLAINAMENEITNLESDIEVYKQETIREYIKNEKFKPEFLKPLKEDILKGLSFVHDYKQINTQISQNINVLIETRYTGETLEEKLTKSTEEEKSIYEASKFLSEKLNLAKFLINPVFLGNREECTSFRFHGLALKYRRIYTSRFHIKKLNIVLTGQSTNMIVANSQAVSVIPHTFIDNAYKYSSKSGKILIHIQDEGKNIVFSVSSYGPKIGKDEMDRIFDPFFRARGAIKQEEEGAGYGLYLCQLVAKVHLGTEVSVSQDSAHKNNGGYWTTFTIEIPERSIILF